MVPKIDTANFAAGRRGAHAALDQLLDQVRDGGALFGRALLELTFQDGAPVRRILTLERSELCSKRDRVTGY
jgi:hypothetical protein